MYSAILWSTQTHCTLQHSPTFSKLSEKNIKGNMFKKVIYITKYIHKKNNVHVPVGEAVIYNCQHYESSWLSCLLLLWTLHLEFTPTRP